VELDAVLRLLVHVRTLVAAAQPLPEGLAALASRMTDREEKELAAGLSREMATGASLSTALQRQATDLPPMVLTLVRSGETGDLLPALDALIDFHQASRRLDRQLDAATNYPRVLLFLVAVLVMPVIGYAGLALTEVVGLPESSPGLFQMFLEEKRYGELLLRLLTLPVWPFQQGWIGWIVTSALAYALLIWKDGPLRAVSGRLARRLYLVGPCLKTALAAEFATATGILVANRVPLDQAVTLAADFAGDKATLSELNLVVEDLARGGLLSESLTRHPLFPESLSWFVAVGELSGDMSRCLLEAGRFYRGEAENLTEVLTQSVEPLMLLLVGLMLAPMILSVMLPLGKMMSNIG
jgi:type IV pilus assembly protein PilC